MDRGTVQAWRTVHIYAQAKAKGRMPKLSTMLQGAKRRPQQPPSIAVQRGVLEILSAQYGIPLRAAGKKAVT